MVDALERSHRIVGPDGCVLDLHPTEEQALVQMGERTIGPVDGGDAPVRHAAAGAAVTTVVREGLFDADRVIDFDFSTYADTIEELRDYIAENWRSTRIDERTVEAARAAAPASVRPRTLERVRLTVLRPSARGGWGQTPRTGRRQRGPLPGV